MIEDENIVELMKHNLIPIAENNGNGNTINYIILGFLGMSTIVIIILIIVNT
jgi:hypothetical protein